MAQKGKYEKGGSWSIASGMNSPKPEKPPKKAAPKAPPKKKPPKKRPAEEAPKPTEAEEKPQTPLQRAWSIISSILSYTLMVAAIGMANSVMALVFSVFSVVITGASVLVSRQIGAHENDQAAQTIEQAVFLTLLITVLVGTGCIVGANGLMRLQLAYMTAISLFSPTAHPRL